MSTHIPHDEKDEIVTITINKKHLRRVAYALSDLIGDGHVWDDEAELLSESIDAIHDAIIGPWP